jgi:hypothetical protein
MRKYTVPSLLLAAAFLCANVAGAADAKPAAKPAKYSVAGKPAAAKSHTASGTIDSFDAAANTLTVKGAKSTWTFSVSDAKVWSGTKSVGVEDLSSHSGAHVTVKYADQGGQKVASSVRIAAAAKHTASKK